MGIEQSPLLADIASWLLTALVRLLGVPWWVWALFVPHYLLAGWANRRNQRYLVTELDEE